MKEPVSELKNRLRVELKRRRDAVTEHANRSSEIRRRVLDLPVIEQANLVCCFVSFRSEVETHGLVDALIASGKQVCVPWCNGDELGLCRIDSLTQLQPLTMGILEPPESMRRDASRVCQVSNAQAVIVPGLAFTAAGDRLGYGKGHYDRMLAKGPDVVRIAVAFECQLEPSLPTDEYDMQMHWVVTEERLIDCGDSASN